MRKVVATAYVTLDGVMEGPEEWHPRYYDDEMEEAIGAATAAADAMLLGRVTYQDFAGYWSGKTNRDARYADRINDMPKYVVSATLEAVGWNNSTLIGGDIAEEVARLKERPGKDISISGSITLVRSLMRADLIDEYRLMVHPVIVGGGRRLFEEGADPKRLELVESKTFASGVLYLTYRPSATEETVAGPWRRSTKDEGVLQ